MTAKSKSYAEITMKSGAVVTFACTELSYRSDGLGASLKWVTPEGAGRQAVHIELEEIAAVIFVGVTL